MESHRVNCIKSGRSPTLHCTLALVTCRDTKTKADLLLYSIFGLRVPDYGTVISLVKVFDCSLSCDSYN